MAHANSSIPGMPCESKAAEESGNTDTVKVLKAGGGIFVVCPRCLSKKRADSDPPMKSEEIYEPIARESIVMVG